MDTFSDKYIQNAKEALLQGDYQAAEIWLREVLRKDLKNREAWVLLHNYNQSKDSFERIRSSLL